MAVSTAARGSVRVQAWFVKADVTDFLSETWLYVVCMCVYVCVNRCFMHMCTWRPEGNFRHHPHVPSTFVFFETGSHLPVTYQVGKAGEPVFPGICFPFLHMASCPACLCVCQMRVGFWEFNLSPHTHKASSLPTDLFLIPGFIVYDHRSFSRTERDHYFVRYLLFGIKLLESFLLNVTPIYSPLIVWSILEAFSSTPGKTWINDVLLTCMPVEAKHSLILWTLLIAKRKAGAVITVYRWGILENERQR